MRQVERGGGALGEKITRGPPKSWRGRRLITLFPLPDCRPSANPRGSYFFVERGGGMMMKHGHAKRVINSCPSCVSPFYSLSARFIERERKSFGTRFVKVWLTRCERQESLINAGFFQRSRLHLFGTFKRERMGSV